MLIVTTRHNQDCSSSADRLPAARADATRGARRQPWAASFTPDRQIAFLGEAEPRAARPGRLPGE